MTVATLGKKMTEGEHDTGWVGTRLKPAGLGLPGNYGFLLAKHEYEAEDHIE